MICLEKVFKSYNAAWHKKIVLDHVPTAFEPGKSYGHLGVNGAVKSTLIRFIAGANLPNSGRIRRTVLVSWPLVFAGLFHPHSWGSKNNELVARQADMFHCKSYEFL